MSFNEEDRRHVRRLTAIVSIAGKVGVRRLSAEQLAELPRLYRHASSLLARLETGEYDPESLARLKPVLLRAHSILYSDLDRPSSGLFARSLRFLLVDSPRAIRAEWKLVLATFAVFYGLALGSFLLVAGDLQLAYTLFSPAAVDAEIAQLRETEDGAPFRGNFTFGFGDSPGAAGAIMGNNMKVAVVFFALGLIPPLYLMAVGTNGLMLGTYTAVATHWGQAGAISSILWCHGVLELQAFVLAGTAGLLLMRAWVAPGPWSRRHAMRLESQRAWHLLAPVFPILVVAGLIEGFVSPHAPLPVRAAVAVLSGVLLALWIGLGGRQADPHVMAVPRGR